MTTPATSPGTPPEDPRQHRARVREVVVVAWVVALVALLLGPALLPGYVLGYDMVWVPDLALTRDALGLASGLPRAVPSDAVVAVLDEVVPGMLLQKLVLVGALVSGGTGIARLLPAPLLLARLVAAAAYVWNPLVVERLVIGHWPLLLAYGVAPWLVVALRSWRDGPLPARTWWLVPLGSLAASSGLTTAVLVLALAVRRGRVRVLLALLLVANAPWLVSGLLHAGSAASDPAAAARFALHDEGVVPAPVAALTLGGIWNADVVPGSRTVALAWLVPVLLLPLAAVGARALRADLSRRTWWALVGCWLVGWVGATLTWLAPGVTGAVAAAVPGAGVLRDGARLLVLSAPLLCLALGRGAQVVATALPPAARVGAALGLLALPVAVLPGVAWGAGVGMRAVDYPSDHPAARRALQAAGPSGDAVLLPFAPFRAPTWNDGRTTLAPTARYLGVDAVTDDRLTVGDVVLDGEDPRARRVRAALQQPTPDDRARALADLGIGVVVTDLDAGPATAVTGEPAHTGETLLVQRLPGVAAPPRAPWWWWVLLAPAWAAYVGAPVGAAVRRIRSGVRRRAD